MPLDPNSSLAAWLGPVAAEATADQIEAIVAASTLIDERWPAPDLGDDRESALSAAVQVIVGDSTLEEIGATWRSARAAEAATRAALTGAIIASRGLAETEIERRSGMSRISVRRALGK